jgi:MFS superfamily sulfate permease-like transporter
VVTVVGDVPAGLPCLRWPTAALGGVLIVAAIGLFDVVSLRRLWQVSRVSRAEFCVAVVTMLGVIALDVLQEIPLAVAVALLLLLRRSARPTQSWAACRG